jgi:hypothetical protein
MLTPIRLALDWTPNTNHTGFYVALAKGTYKKAGLDVQIISPDIDNYQLTPAKRVALGQADLAITPSESVISFQTKGVPLVGSSGCAGPRRECNHYAQTKWYHQTSAVGWQGVCLLRSAVRRRDHPADDSE